MAVTWAEIAGSHLAAAKLPVRDHPRSAVSRSYYAMHVALTDALLEAGYIMPDDRETPPHNHQADLIGKHLGSFGRPRVNDMRRLVRRAYRRRVDADYRRTIVVGVADAVEAVRDASSFLVILGRRPST